jgi:hypothetical protein
LINIATAGSPSNLSFEASTKTVPLTALRGFLEAKVRADISAAFTSNIFVAANKSTQQL